MSIDIYLDRVYNRSTYNCGHFVADVWQDLTGQAIHEAVAGIAQPVGKGRAVLTQLRTFKRIREPVSPCIVMLNPPRGLPHIGIYLRGRILHITETGVGFDHIEVASVGFKQVRFYECLTK